VNLVGVDVTSLDVAAFLAQARVVYLLVAAVWIALVARYRSPLLLLAGVLGANAWAWGVTNYPLQSLYGLLNSSDRVGNLGLVQVVAAGNSPLRTHQAGQLTFEPFWGLLVATLSGFEPERVLRLYPFLSLAVALGFAATLFVALRDDEGGSPWEAALVAGFATLLSSAPLEYAGTYRVPWAMTFLLKPNHALGLVLLPVVLRAVARIRGGRDRLIAGLLLHLLGWVFVIHMAYVCVGLVVFAAWAWLEGRRDARRDAVDVAVVIGINLAIVSPYLLMLLVGYPFLHSSPGYAIYALSPHLLEGSLKQGLLLPLAILGLVALRRRDTRLARVLASQVLAAWLMWAGYLVLSALQQARERDEIYYWVRLLTAIAAGIGSFDLAGRAAAAFRPLAEPAVRAAAVCLLALPWSLPSWWDPRVMDSYFEESLRPLPARLKEPTDFLRRETERSAIVAGDRDYARFVAALGARRVSLATNLHMPSDYGERDELERRLLLEWDSAVLATARARGVTHLLVTPALLARHPTVRLEEMGTRPHLRNDFLWMEPSGDFVAIFRLVDPAR
jgi:hypothetical protein